VAQSGRRTRPPTGGICYIIPHLSRNNLSHHADGKHAGHAQDDTDTVEVRIGVERPASAAPSSALRAPSPRGEKGESRGCGPQGVAFGAPSPRPSLWAQGVRRCNRFTGSIAGACGGTIGRCVCRTVSRPFALGSGRSQLQSIHWIDCSRLRRHRCSPTRNP